MSDKGASLSLEQIRKAHATWMEQIERGQVPPDEPPSEQEDLPM
jgi:hypothetical protein